MVSKWKEFERLTAAIETLIHRGARVQWNTKIRGRQIDVEVRFGTNADAPLLIVECKWRKSGKVRVDAIEAFASKAKRLGATRAAFATNTGYQSGAREAARELGVEIYSVQELVNEWPRVVDETLLLPVCNVYNVSLITSSRSALELPNEPQSLAAVRFQIPEKAPVGLDFLVTRALPDWRCHFEPYRFQIQLPEECEAFIPSLGLRVPINSVMVTARCVRVSQTFTTHWPPEIRRRTIHHLNELSGSIRSIPDTELPIGFDTKLEPGKYYRNVWGLEYRCEAVNASEAQMVLLPTNRQHGGTLSGRAIIAMPFSEHYEEISDADAKHRLDAAYKQYLEYCKYPDEISRGRAIPILEKGVVLMQHPPRDPVDPGPREA